jgi:hypothetical protein
LEAGAVTGLFQYLRDHGLEGPHGLSVLRELKILAPERLSEAVDCAMGRGIATETKYRLAEFLAETDALLPRAIQFMRDYLTDESTADRKAEATFFLQSYLIRAQQWSEVVKLYDPKAHAVGEALWWSELFNVGMAHWAEGGAVPEGVLEEIRQRLEQSEFLARLGQYDPWVCSLEVKSWLLRWRGDNEHALRFLGPWIEIIDKWIKDRDSMMHQSWWSFWRYRGVQLSQYRDDCEQLRRMIQGEQIRPPFVGDSAGAK